MTVHEIFRVIYKQLKSAGIDQPHLEASWIVEKYGEITELDRIKAPEALLTKAANDKIMSATTRRSLGEPLAYIFGEKEFYGRVFKVDKNVLIPRPETEQLVEWALRWIKNNIRSEEIQILDLGSGSGCIGLTLLKEYDRAKLTALDISKEALEISKMNAKTLGVSERVEFIQLDAAKAGHLLNKFDLVLANPPYVAFCDVNVEVNVKKFEPSIALFSDENGLSHTRQWLKALPPILKEVSAVGFEIGCTQAESIAAMFRDLSEFSKHYILKDYADLDRFVCGEKLKR
jgi:release factor glutamine methyltransferase